MQYKKLTIIGTSHIAKQSLKEIEEAFGRHKPEIVAVELDRRRLHSLLTDEKAHAGIGQIPKVGLKGYLFALIGGWLQRKLGTAVGVMPGSEMKLAVEFARKTKAKIALIDQDIEVTLRKFSQRLTWKEKFRFVGDLLKSVFFKKRSLREIGIDPNSFDLSKVPEKELVRKLILQLKDRYPNVYDVLVRERNVIMANNLAKLMHKYPDETVLAVVGAGHEEEMIEMVRKRLEGKADVV
ncbi:TraB/GumN family protein [Candidatus Woesearchaeota archaeon]|nr:TraB/GumN family protein [Candidatus Woesearchaeota archaeon]